MFSSNTSQVSDEKLYSEDVFSTFLYTGNGGTQTITNGIDLAGKGGMVWTKNRTTASSPQNNHRLYDTARGMVSPSNALISNTTDAQNGLSVFSSINSNGFTLGGGNPSASNVNGDTYASWTFRKAPKFFDVVTYTGNGSTQSISHNLGTAPGTIIVKSYGAGGSWIVYHQSLGAGSRLFLNATNAATTTVPETVWGNNTTTVAPTSTDFTTGSALNVNGDTYVAYLFAHDTTSDGIIQCGSYTGNEGTQDIQLGWEPQWLLIKRTDSSTSGGWHIIDNMRGFPTNTNCNYVDANSANAETDLAKVGPRATGFGITTDASPAVNANGATYIYIAIRRGPMRTPTSGTSVFTPALGQQISLPNFKSNSFPVDLVTLMWRDGIENKSLFSRLTGANYLRTNLTNGEVTDGSGKFDYQNGWYSLLSFDNTWVSHQFRRAPGFMDVVCYTGTGIARTVNHNLGVAPELMIVKRRNGATNWPVYSSALGATKYLFLNLTNASDGSDYWNNTSPTATQFSVDGSSVTNASTGTYAAYLFASCPGVSKVGSYTGNGSSQTINCGFAAGARFVMIKRTDSTGDWYVWDTARGIVAGNDPYLRLNSTAAEVTTNDSVDTDSSGFVVNQLSATNINVSSATYIYLAVA